MAYMNSKEPQYRTIADVIIMALAKSKNSLRKLPITTFIRIGGSLYIWKGGRLLKLEFMLTLIFVSQRYF